MLFFIQKNNVEPPKSSILGSLVLMVNDFGVSGINYD